MLETDRIFGSIKLMMAITSCWIKVKNLGSQTNSKKYGEKYPKQVCQQNLYPMFNHDNYKSQSQYDHFEAHTFTNLT